MQDPGAESSGRGNSEPWPEETGGGGVDTTGEGEEERRPSGNGPQSRDPEGP